MVKSILEIGWKEFGVMKGFSPLLWREDFKNSGRGIGWLRMSFRKIEMLEFHRFGEFKDV